MTEPHKILCRDIYGDAHLVDRDKLIKRAASYALIVDDGKILLVCDKSNNKRWDFPGGGVDPGETSLEALQREVREETGLEVMGDPKLVCNFVEYFYDVAGKAGWESHRSYYLTTVAGMVNTHGNDDDITDIRYIPLPLDESTLTAPVVSLLVKEL